MDDFAGADVSGGARAAFYDVEGSETAEIEGFAFCEFAAEDFYEAVYCFCGGGEEEGVRGSG